MKQSSTQDHYAALGVSRDASEQEIRGAFRTLAKRRHPDKNRGNPRAHALFEEIVEAYRTLTDEAKRRNYDRETKPRPETPHTLCYDLFALLLAEQPEEALETLDKLLMRLKASVCALNLRLYLNEEDAADCEFLMAEALENAGQRDEAVLLYERSLMREARRPHFRKFAEEIRLRLRRLRFDRLVEKAGGEAGRQMKPRQALEPIFELGATNKQRADYCQKLADALKEAGHVKSARRFLDEARCFSTVLFNKKAPHSQYGAPRPEAEERHAELQADAGI